MINIKQASHLHILVKKFQVWLFGFVRGMYSMFDSEKILRSVFFVALFHRDFLTLCTAGLCMIDSPRFCLPSKVKSLNSFIIRLDDRKSDGWGCRLGDLAVKKQQRKSLSARSKIENY
jgi:hypothetical protein